MYRLCWNSYICLWSYILENNLVVILLCSWTICTFAMALSCQIAGLIFGLTKLPTCLVPNLVNGGWLLWISRVFETIRRGEIPNNAFHDSLPMQMPNSTQSKLRRLVLLQKKYLYTRKNIVTKPNLDEFLRKLFEQYGIENCAKQY